LDEDALLATTLEPPYSRQLPGISPQKIHSERLKFLFCRHEVRLLCARRYFLYAAEQY
jgi:hypothetical protein